MTFGGYDEDMIKVGNEKEGYGIHWYKLVGTNWWQIEV
jgi:hypothetical protein